MRRVASSYRRLQEAGGPVLLFVLRLLVALVVLDPHLATHAIEIGTMAAVWRAATMTTMMASLPVTPGMIGALPRLAAEAVALLLAAGLAVRPMAMLLFLLAPLGGPSSVGDEGLYWLLLIAFLIVEGGGHFGLDGWIATVLRKTTPDDTDDLPHIVVVGGGFAGHAAVRGLDRGHEPLTRTRENKYYALVGFWRYAISRGYASRSPLPVNELRSPERAPPYIYSRDELARLLDPATVEASRRGAVQFDAVTFRTLIILLYGAGLRYGEASRLTLADVDLTNAVLTIRATKFYKTRLVPVSAELAAVLDSHMARRRRAGVADGGNALLLGEPGRDAAREQHGAGCVRHA